MPRSDGESSVITFNPLELAALLDGLLRGGIDATGGLSEVEGCGAHIAFSSIYNLWQALQENNVIWQ